MGALTREHYQTVIDLLSNEPASAAMVAEAMGTTRTYTGQVLRRWYEAGALDRTELPPPNGMGRATYLYGPTERAHDRDVIEACFTRGQKISSPTKPERPAAVVHRARQGESVAAVLDAMPTDLFSFTVTTHGLVMTFDQGQRLLAFVDALRRAASDAA